MLLFVYGVLQQGPQTWPFLRGIGPGRPATTRGALFAIPDPHGWYPALLQRAEADGTTVSGMVHTAGSVDLAAVDAFEGADYRRSAIDVRIGQEPVIGEAYLWARPLPRHAEPIPHGDFRRWLAETGRAPFAGAG